MNSGDRVLLTGLALVAIGLAGDRITAGLVGDWIMANLSGFGAYTGQTLGWLGWMMTPLVIAPLFSGLIGRFTGLPSSFANLLERAIKITDALSMMLADMVRWAALALVLLTALIVIQRYVFGISLTKLQESVIYLHAVLFLFSSAATLCTGGHVRVDILYSRLNARGKAWTNLAGVYLALIPMCWLILETSKPYVGDAWRILERSRESDGLPLVFLLKTAIPVFAVTMIAQGAALAGRAALILSGHKTLTSGRDNAEHGP